MSARKATRRPKARKTTKRPDVGTAVQRDEAIRTLLEGGQFNAVCRGSFCEVERDLPILGLPRPKKCPFCGEGTAVKIAFKDRKDSEGRTYTTATAECQICGCEAPGACSTTLGDASDFALAFEAAKRWNGRGGAT